MVSPLSFSSARQMASGCSRARNASASRLKSSTRRSRREGAPMGIPFDSLKRRLALRGDRLQQPVAHDGGDVVAVLFQHHHVAIAANAVVAEPDHGVLDAG